jgi:hypothetical protein
MLYFAHGGVDDGHPNEPIVGSPDIHPPPLPRTTTTAPTGTESSFTSDHWLPLTGLVAGILVIVIAAVILILRHKHSSYKG